MSVFLPAKNDTNRLSSAASTIVSSTSNSGLQVASAPINDQCSNIQTPLSTDGITCTAGSHIGATLDLNLPADCPNLNATSNITGVWYSVVGTDSGVLQAASCKQEKNAEVQILVFQGDCDSLTCVATTNPETNFPFGFPKVRTQWLSESGVKYHVLVAEDKIFQVDGTYGLEISKFESPVNGKCENAMMHPADGSLVTGSSFVLSEQSPELPPNCSGQTIINDLIIKRNLPERWFTVIGTGEQMIADTCHEETDFSVEFKVFTGSCGRSLECNVPLTRIACNMDFIYNTDGGYRASWDSLKGEKYYIMVQAYGSIEVGLGYPGVHLFGNFGLTIGSLVRPTNDQCSDTQTAEAVNKSFEGTLIGATPDASDTAAQGNCVDDALQSLRIKLLKKISSTTWHTVIGTGRTLVAEIIEPRQAVFSILLVYEGSCNSLLCPTGLEFSSSKTPNSQSKWDSVAGRKYFVVMVVLDPVDGWNWQNDYKLTISEETNTGEICFPGDSTVDVMNKGLIRLDALEIGDYVRVGSGDTLAFDRVYSFGHKDERTMAAYLRIVVSESIATPLVISRAHMVFVQQEGNLAVPASSLVVGDTVLMQTGDLGVITEIEEVIRRGVYAPFTMSGRIVVNGIVASSYVSLQEEQGVAGQFSHKLMVGGIETPLSMQWTAHLVQAPHRLLCRLQWEHFCQKETYTDSGLSWWSAGTLGFAHWLLRLNGTLMALIGAPLLLVLMMFSLLEGALQHLVDSHHYVGLLLAILYCRVFRDHRARRHIKKEV